MARSILNIRKLAPYKNFPLYLVYSIASARGTKMRAIYGIIQLYIAQWITSSKRRVEFKQQYFSENETDNISKSTYTVTNFHASDELF